MESPTFTDLGISGVLEESIRTLGWTAPTEIQAGCIPEAIQGRDIIGLAETGSLCYLYDISIELQFSLRTCRIWKDGCVCYPDLTCAAFEPSTTVRCRFGTHERACVSD